MRLSRFSMFITLLCATALSAGCKPKEQKPPVHLPPTHAPTDHAVVEDPVAKGRLIFGGTTYSATGLTCAHCHAAAPESDARQLYIAHSAYGLTSRGAWWITTQAQLDAKQGAAATLAGAANKCVSAPYMSGTRMIEGDDAKALEAFLSFIAKPEGKDAKPFIIKQATALPPKGLKPNLENGKRIYEMSCSHCHGVVKGIADLKGAKDWLNEVQVMAKLRKLGDWFNDNKNAKYAYTPYRGAHLAQWLGLAPALAAEPAPGEGAPPEAGAQPPAEGAGADQSGDSGGQDIFPKDAMPFFATDILSDQEVVDVAFYVIHKL